METINKNIFENLSSVFENRINYFIKNELIKEIDGFFSLYPFLKNYSSIFALNVIEINKHSPEKLLDYFHSKGALYEYGDMLNIKKASIYGNIKAFYYYLDKVESYKKYENSYECLSNFIKSDLESEFFYDIFKKWKESSIEKIDAYSLLHNCLFLSDISKRISFCIEISNIAYSFKDQGFFSFSIECLIKKLYDINSKDSINAIYEISKKWNSVIKNILNKKNDILKYPSKDYRDFLKSIELYAS